MSNTTLVTTGIIPLTVGSIYRFQPSFVANGLPWNVDSATFLVKDANGTTTTYPMMVSGSSAYYDWTVPSAGEWTYAFKGIKNGTIQISRPYAMTTIDSP